MSRRPPKVVIGFADALAAPEVAFSLRAAGFAVTAFARKGARVTLRLVDGVEIAEISAPEHDALETATEIAALCERLQAAALMPLDDAAVWLCDRATASASTTALVGPSEGRARLALDKRLQLQAASAAGFEVPETVDAESPAHVERAPLPAILRGALAIAEIGGRLAKAPSRMCGTQEELDRFLARWPLGQPILVQPVLPGVGEGIFGLMREGRLESPSAHRRIRMMNPRGSGSSACRSVAADPAAAAAAARFLSAATWTGLAMIELLRLPDGRLVFVELNGRPWGSMALARSLGLEYPAWAVRTELDPTFRPPAEPAAGELVCRHLGRELVHLAIVARGPRGYRPPTWPGRWETFRSVLRVSRRDRWYNWRRDQKRFFVADTVQTLKAQLR